MNRKITVTVIILISLALNLHAQNADTTAKKLPRTYYILAKGFYKDKNYPEAIANYEKAVQYAFQTGDTATADTSKLFLSAIYTYLGNTELNNDSLDLAIENYNKALSYKSRNYLAYYGLGQVFMKRENLPEMKSAFDKAIAMAGKDAKTIGKARSAAASAYQKTGAMALQSNKFNDAVANLQNSLLYNNTEPRTYFYLAIAFNRLSSWDDAIASAKKALELQSGDKSDIYYQMGYSYGMKGSKAAACEAFKKVIAGNNVTAAKYQVEQVLKCPQ
jgi:tetratricopeptide (TPR) repeat protein